MCSECGCTAEDCFISTFTSGLSFVDSFTLCPGAIAAPAWKYGYCVDCHAELTPALDGDAATLCSKHAYTRSRVA